MNTNAMNMNMNGLFIVHGFEEIAIPWEFSKNQERFTLFGSYDERFVHGHKKTDRAGGDRLNPSIKI